MIVKSENLIEAVEGVNLVPQRGGIIPSEFIQLQKKGSRLLLSLASEVFGNTVSACEKNGDGDWTFFVDRTSFVPFATVNRGQPNQKPFEFSHIEKKNNKSQLLIKQGRRKVTFNTVQHIDGYGNIKIQSTADLRLNEQQKRLLTLASKYATPDPTLSDINCVYLVKNKYVLATNGAVLFSASDAALPVSVPFPMALLGLLTSDYAKSVSISKDMLCVNLSCGYLCQPLNKKAQKDFPQESILNQMEAGRKNPLQFMIRAKPFVEAMQRLSFYIKTVVNRELIVTVKTPKGDSKLQLLCDTPQGRFVETVGTKGEVASDIQVDWLLDSITPLVDFEKGLSTISVRFNEEKKTPYYLSTKEGIELVMSRRTA